MNILDIGTTVNEGELFTHVTMTYHILRLNEQQVKIDALMKVVEASRVFKNQYRSFISLEYDEALKALDQLKSDL